MTEAFEPRQRGQAIELLRACSLTGYFAVAERLGLNVAPLLRRAGVALSMMSDPEQMLPARSVVRLLEDSAAASGCITFGLQMAAERRVSDIGIVSLLIVHQPTLRDSLEVLSEFRNRLNSHLTLQVEEHGDTIFLRQHFALTPPMVSRQANDAALGIHYKMCRAIMGDDWRPQRVCLSCERPAAHHRAIYDRLFDCPLEFGADFDGIIVDASDLARQRPRWDAALAGHARELVRATIDPGKRTMIEEVEQSIRLLMPAGRASLAGVADALGVSVRTLQRHLDLKETSFSSLLDRIRTQQVCEHFANSRLRLTDIAHLLGFSTQASFSTWYRTRFHETPRAGRLRTQGGEALEPGKGGRPHLARLERKPECRRCRNHPSGGQPWLPTWRGPRRSPPRQAPGPGDRQGLMPDPEVVRTSGRRRLRSIRLQNAAALCTSLERSEY